jgi:glycine/D-amino acid oxidase-like deaminating enzyme
MATVGIAGGGIAGTAAAYGLRESPPTMPTVAILVVYQPGA